jgi:hypothetical protein
VLATATATAAPSGGKSAGGSGTASRMALSAPAPSNATRSGCSVESIIAATKAAAPATVSKVQSRAPQAGGMGWSRSVTSASTPSVPSEPTMSFGTS